MQGQRGDDYNVCFKDENTRCIRYFYIKGDNIIKIRSKELKQVKLNQGQENKFNHMTDYSTILKKPTKTSGYEKPRLLLK